MALSKVRSLVVVAMVAVLSACAGSPIKVAQTIEQKAYATYGTFVIVEEQAGKLTSSSTNLSPDVKRRIVVAAQSAQPAVDTMLKGLNSYQAARDDFEAQKIQKPAFQIVVDNLGNWVTQASSLVANLALAVKGAR